MNSLLDFHHKKVCIITFKITKIDQKTAKNAKNFGVLKVFLKQ